MNIEILTYNQSLNASDKMICDKLQTIIDENISNSSSKVWHGHPVWFIDENPILGYSKLKAGIQLLFWSGQSFDEKDLEPIGKSKAAAFVYKNESEIDEEKLKIWVQKSIDIQWDYKNMIKRKGELTRIL